MRTEGKPPKAHYFYPPTKDKLQVEIKRITSLSVSMLKKADKTSLHLLGRCLQDLLKLTKETPSAYFQPTTKVGKLKIEIQRIRSIAVSMAQKANIVELHLLGICLNTLLKLTETKYKQLENLC